MVSEKGSLQETVVMMNRDNRLRWPDAAKGAAIFLVALGHSVIVSDMIKYWIYSFHIPVFFFISGYFLKLKENSVKKTVCRKACSLFPLYFVCSMMAFIAESMIADNVKWERLIGIFVCQQGGKFDGYLWFFPALFGVQCILSVLLKFLKKPVYIFGTCFLLAAAAYLWSRAGAARLFWHFDSAFLLAPFAGLGIVVKNNENRFQKQLEPLGRKWLIIAVLLFLNLCFCVINSKSAAGHIDYNMLVTNEVFTCYGSGIAGVLWIFFFCGQFPRMRWLEFVGENSAVYYCLNWIGSRLSLNILPAVPMTIIAMFALWAVPIPVVLILNRWFPWVVGKSAGRREIRKNK